MNLTLVKVAILGAAINSIHAEAQVGSEYSVASAFTNSATPSPNKANSARSSAKEAFGVVSSIIKVEASHGDSTEGFERRISMEEVSTSAGTFGDPARFLQMLPG